MCLMCDITGRDYYHKDEVSEDPDINNQDTGSSEAKTLNFNDGNNIIVLDNNNTTFRGLAGDDVYIISGKTVNKNAKINIVDTNGINTIQLVENIKITKSLFSSDAVRLILDNGAEITINGADKFTFDLTGNLTSGNIGSQKTFKEFAEFMGLDSLPTSGTKNGTENITITIDGKVTDETKKDNEDGNQSIDSRSIQSDLSNFPLDDNVSISNNKETEINLNDFFSAPKTNAIGYSDLSAINSLDEINVIKIDQTNIGATIAVKDNKKGLKLLDLKTLNIDQGSLSIKDWSQYINDDGELVGYWEKEEYEWGVYTKFEVKENYLYLAPKSYFLKGGESSSDKFFFEYTAKEENGDLKTPFTTSDSLFSNNPNASQFKIKLEYTSEGEEKEYTIRLDSIFDKDTDISIYQDKIDSISYASLKFEIYDNSHAFFTRDQILLEDSKLKIKGGVDNAEVFPVYFKIRASVINSDGYEYDNPEDGYSELELTVMMTDDDYVRTQSSKIIETKNNETSISIEEDNPGDILLDLSDFNIDPGTAKIKTVKINHWEDYDPFDQYISETFYIDENVLKFTEGTLYDYDSDVLTWISYNKNSEENAYGSSSDGRYYPTYDVRENDFEITFTYKSNNKDFEHILKIVEYENTKYGSLFSSDHVLTYSDDTTNNKFINALNTSTRFPHLNSEKESYLMKESEWTNYETTITYAFLDTKKEQFHRLGKIEDSIYFEPFTDFDTAHSYNDIGKSMIRDILEKTSKIFKVTFEEVELDIAQIRFSLYTSTGSEGATNYANYPGRTPSDHVLVGDEEDFEDASYLEVNPGGGKYNVAIHELGHNLGLSHPFAGYPDKPGYADSYYANSLFTVMAYAAFWSKEVDIYELDPQGKYSSYAYSISGIFKESRYGTTEDYIIDQPSWGRDDILTLGYMYGLRDNYNNEDTIYSWSEKENIYETIHDMGGNDTIDLSNYDWDMEIDLNPGAVSEVGVGRNRIHWNSKEGEKTGDIFILSWETIIEEYVGSSGSNIITLNNKISNTVDLSISKKTNIISKAIPSDIIIGSPNEDYVHVIISSIDEINDSINIDGGADFDWLIVEAPPKITSLENIDLIILDKDANKAKFAIKEGKKGLEILDLSFLNIDEGSLKFSVWTSYKNNDDEVVSYWEKEEYSSGIWNKLDVVGDFLYFAPQSYFSKLNGDKFYFEFIGKSEDGSLKDPFITSDDLLENFKIRLEYTSQNNANEYIIELDSIFTDTTPYTNYFESDDGLNLNFDLNELLTHFDNIENFDFTNNEKNTITITEATFELSNKTKIKGDEDDKIILPDNALQINSDDLYLYYALNDNEIGISVDLMLV